MTGRAGRPAARIVLAAICLLVAAALFGVVARLSFANNAVDRDVLQRERYGAAMLHPMTGLLVELANAQSAAVRGDKIDQNAVRQALSSVANQDAANGGVLGTHQRLTDLTTAVQAAFGRQETGRAAYQTYSELVDLTVDLIHRIGDTAQLVHDQDLDAYYLVDVAITRLPDAMVYAGRVADLVGLAGGRALTGEDAMRAAVARFSVAYDSEQATAGLATSVDNTANAKLSTDITQRLDSFLAAVDSFAPPTMLQELVTTVDAMTVADGATRVFHASSDLAHLLLSELQVLLDTRSHALDQRDQLLIGASVAAGLVGVALAALLVFAALRPARPAGVAAEAGTSAVPPAKTARPGQGDLVGAARGPGRHDATAPSGGWAGRDAR